MINLKELTQYVIQRTQMDPQAITAMKNKVIESQNLASIRYGISFIMILDEKTSNYQLSIVENHLDPIEDRLTTKGFISFKKAIKDKIALHKTETTHIICVFTLIPLKPKIIELTHKLLYALITENAYDIILEGFSCQRDDEDDYNFEKDEFVTSTLPAITLLHELFYTLQNPIIQN